MGRFQSFFSLRRWFLCLFFSSFGISKLRHSQICDKVVTERQKKSADAMTRMEVCMCVWEREKGKSHAFLEEKNLISFYFIILTAHMHTHTPSIFELATGLQKQVSVSSAAHDLYFIIIIRFDSDPFGCSFILCVFDAFRRIKFRLWFTCKISRAIIRISCAHKNDKLKCKVYLFFFSEFCIHSHCMCGIRCAPTLCMYLYTVSWFDILGRWTTAYTLTDAFFAGSLITDTSNS